MFEYARTYLDSEDNVEFPGRSGSYSDLELPLESSAAKPPFSEQASSKITTVDIGGQTYRVPSQLSKQFYLDLTYMEDEELISTYMLVKYVKQKRPSSFWSRAKMGDLKR